MRFVQQWYSFSGAGGSRDEHESDEPAADRRVFLEDGWSVGYSGNILANWKADAGDVWTVPLGVAVGKVQKFGKLPIKIQLAVQYMVVRPDEFGQKWNFQLRFVPVLPKLIKGNLADPSSLHFGMAGVPLLESLNQTDPDNPVVLFNLGMAYSDLGRLDEARPTLRSSRDRSAVRLRLGGARRRSGAEPEDRRGARVIPYCPGAEPDNPYAERNIGAALGNAGNLEEAEKHLRRARSLLRKDQRPLLGLAQASSKRERFDEANELYLKSIRMDPDSPLAEGPDKPEARSLIGGFDQGRSANSDPMPPCTVSPPSKSLNGSPPGYSAPSSSRLLRLVGAAWT